MSVLRNLVVDVHTHLYLPRYVEFLRQRAQVPRIFTRNDGSERLLILDDEPPSGRPVNSQVNGPVASLQSAILNILASITRDSSTGTGRKNLVGW